MNRYNAKVVGPSSDQRSTSIKSMTIDIRATRSLPSHSLSPRGNSRISTCIESCRVTVTRRSRQNQETIMWLVLNLNSYTIVGRHDKFKAQLVPTTAPSFSSFEYKLILHSPNCKSFIRSPSHFLVFMAHQSNARSERPWLNLQ